MNVDEHPLYARWAKMRERCEKPHSPDYYLYGARGIKVCASWCIKDGNGFRQFVVDMGKLPSKKHSIDRIDPNGNYEPSNCRWATWSEQNNNHRNNVKFSYKGKRMNQEAWAREIGISSSTLIGRLKRGWSLERTLSTPRLPPAFR